MGAIQFIENIDRTSLTVSDEEFERNVEAAVSTIAEGHQSLPSFSLQSRQPRQVQLPIKSGLSQAEVVPRNSIGAECSTPREDPFSRGRVETPASGDGAEESTAIDGLLRTIQRPLVGLGKIFSEDLRHLPQNGPQRLAAPPQSPRRLSPTIFQPPRHSEDIGRHDDGSEASVEIAGSHARRANAEDAAARQASAESAEARRIQTAEHHNVVE